MPLFRLTSRYAVGVAADSPAGAVSAMPVRAGVPRLGLPSPFQLNFCARVVRPFPQPPPDELLA